MEWKERETFRKYFEELANMIPEELTSNEVEAGLKDKIEELQNIISNDLTTIDNLVKSKYRNIKLKNMIVQTT
jgi:hypothetical protein